MKILAYTYTNTHDNSSMTEFFPINSLQDRLEIIDAILDDFNNDNERTLKSIDIYDVVHTRHICTSIDRQTAELAVKMYETKVPIRLMEDYMKNYSTNMNTEQFVEQWIASKG